MKKTLFRVLVILITSTLLLSVFAGCGTVHVFKQAEKRNNQSALPLVNPQVDFVDEAGTKVENLDIEVSPSVARLPSLEPTGDFQEGIVLVKTEDFCEEMLGSLEYKKAEPLYPNSVWYEIALGDEIDTQEAVKYLSSLEVFEQVDYDYIMAADGEVESIDISGNSYESNPGYFLPMAIQDAWKSMKKDGVSPGGDPSVIVAVIDTGVDYNHVDLRNNIWVNSGEIPDNGIDDDGNGYVDDVYGWNFVGNNNNPMDDNGHGTHCAGIVAAENNHIGTVGIAYNCKVMCLKAGASSGTFNNSDIAEAVRYAYMNGASVISMSFGGTSISLAVKDALVDAFNQCVLVAAAGNNGLCNQPDCPVHYPTMVFYPAALTYVIGVMSCDGTGMHRSGFSNFDHYTYNTYEYDVFAPGEQVSSTFPSNRYAKLSGTSMATPQVAAIAALVRSKFQDRDMYSSKFITAQLVRGSGDYICVDAYDALNTLPTPCIYGIYDYYVFDNVEFDPEHNNGNGIIEAGETVHLGFELMNRGGKATDVMVSVNTQRLEADITDPYIHILSNDIMYSEIGTYSIRDGGKIYDENGFVIDVENPIVIKIDEDTPNDYYSTVNFVVSYSNGLNNQDKTQYWGQGAIGFTITNGYFLPSIINEDTVFTANRRYIVMNRVTIPNGVSVTFSEGCEIQFYGNTINSFQAIMQTPGFDVYGTLKIEGTSDKMINLSISELWENYGTTFNALSDNAIIELNYCNAKNISISSYNGTRNEYIRNSKLSYDCELFYVVNNGFHEWRGNLELNNLSDCIVDFRRVGTPHITINSISNSLILLGTSGSSWSPPGNNLNLVGNVIGNVFISKHCEPFLEKFVLTFAGNGICDNNTFLIGSNVKSLNELYCFNIGSSSSTLAGNNYFDKEFVKYGDSLFLNNITSDGKLKFDYLSIGNYDSAVVFPYITGIQLYDGDGESGTVFDTSEYKVKVFFSREMDTEKPFNLFYGSRYPFSDNKVTGEFISPICWEGTIQVNASLEGGTQYFHSTGGSAKGNPEKILADNASHYSFTIDINSVLSMAIQAEDNDNGINLTWIQDDYETLMGYNIYRSEEKDGNYVKLNTSVIPAGENIFLDENAEPGKTYWYTFTVVLSDMSESSPAGKVSCQARDTLAPNAYHTPVNQGYLNNNLVISCTASDNVGISEVKLYYRTIGDSEWKTLAMSKQNDRFSGTIFGSELSLDGLEYYITISDGVSTITKGSSDSPYTVVIKDASAIATLGDVDGDGVITTKDALMIMQAINGDLILTDDQFKRANLNNDSVLSSVEALRILQYINGNVNTLSMS